MNGLLPLVLEPTEQEVRRVRRGKNPASRQRRSSRATPQLPTQPMIEQCESDSDCAVGFFCNGCICTPEVSPECEGATCSTFIPCNPDSGCSAPVCATTPDRGGVCLEGATGCAGLAPCATSADCPVSGSACAVDTCCGAAGVCVDPSAFCRPGATATAQPAPIKTKGSTISQGSN